MVSIVPNYSLYLLKWWKEATNLETKCAAGCEECAIKIIIDLMDQMACPCGVKIFYDEFGEDTKIEAQNWEIEIIYANDHNYVNNSIG